MNNILHTNDAPVGDISFPNPYPDLVASTYAYQNRGHFSGGVQNPYQQKFQHNNASNPEKWCDICDRGFPNDYLLRKHNQEHQTCNIDGCKYIAHPNVITKHIQMQHSNGLYNRIRSNNTPEDIAKWVNDRKRRYPSKENVEKQQKINAEKEARGEKLKSDPRKTRTHFEKSKFDSHRGKGRRFRGSLRSNPNNNNCKQGNNDKKSFITKKPVQLNIAVIDDINKDDWNGDLPPFPGTKLIFQYESSSEESSDEVGDESFDLNNDQFEDEEWEQQSTTSNNITIKNALGMLMNNYGSSEDEEIEEVPKGCCELSHGSKYPSLTLKSVTVIEDKTGIECNESNPDEGPPEEIAVAKEQESPVVDNTKKSKRDQKDEDNSMKNNKTNYIEPPQKKYRRKETLLEKLLRNEIRHERNILLQCVKYIVSNDYFGLNKNVTIVKEEN